MAKKKDDSRGKSRATDEQKEYLLLMQVGKCKYCDENLDNKSDSRVRQLTPRKEGGRDEPENWVLVCETCDGTVSINIRMPKWLDNEIGKKVDDKEYKSKNKLIVSAAHTLCSGMYGPLEIQTKPVVLDIDRKAAGEVVEKKLGGISIEQLDAMEKEGAELLEKAEEYISKVRDMHQKLTTGIAKNRLKSIIKNYPLENLSADTGISLKLPDDLAGLEEE